MTLRYGSDFLEFDGKMELSFNTQLFGIINTSVRSYSFDVPNTVQNRKLLGVTSPADPEIFSTKIWILNNGFNDVAGKVSVEGSDDDKITINFFSDINSLIKLLDISIRDIYSFGNNAPFTYQGNEFDGTSWFLAPPVNTGNNQQLISRNFQDDGFYNNLPCFYVKNIIEELTKQVGIKIDGSLFKDGIYKNLLMSNDKIKIEYDEKYITDNTVYVVVTSSQMITAGTTAVISFVTNPPDYFDNPNRWDTSSHRFISFTDSYYLFELKYDISVVSAPTTNPLMSIYKDGVSISGTEIPLLVGTGTVIGSIIIPVLVSPGHFYDVRLTAPALNNVVVQNTSTYLRIYPFNTYQHNETTLIGNTDNLLPRLMMPDMTGTEFIKNATSIFNPLIQFNSNTGTLSVNLFKDVKHNPEINWSDYIKSYSFSYYEDFINNFAKNSYMKYGDSDEDKIKSYNKKFKTGFGDGVLTVQNDFIDKQNDLFQTKFGASTHSHNESVIMSLPDFPFYSRSVDGSKVTISDVNKTISGCIYVAAFTTSTDHGLKVGDYIVLSDFSTTSEYNGFAKVYSITDNVTFSVQMRYANTEHITGAFSKITINENNLNNKLLIGITNVNVEDDYYPGFLWYDCSNILQTGDQYCYAYFVNPLPNGPGNTGVLNLCLDKPKITGLDNSLTMKDIYWREFQDILNKPVVLVAKMLLPEVQIFNLDLSVPIRITTEKFSGLFMMLDCQGYVDVNTECEVRLLKIS